MALQTIALRDTNGTAFDARVDLDDGILIVHSRSGGGATARNIDYKPTVVAILDRLANAEIEVSIYLDSRPVQSQPLASRLLAAPGQLRGTGEEKFAALVKGMNAKRASNGAWSRVMLTAPGASAANLRTALGVVTPQSRPLVERLSTTQQRQVRPQHIHAAILKLAAGADAPNFADSRDYDLVTPGGLRFPPKKVFGLALEAALGVEAFPGHFSAGWSQPSFELLQAAGYQIVEKDVPVPGEGAPKPGAPQIPAADDDRRWAEGNPKRVAHVRRERAAGLARMKKAAVLAAIGKLACEECHFEPAEVHGPAFFDAGLDVHHTLPLAQVPTGHKTKLSELRLLCATCHRIEHRRIALANK